MNGYVCWYDYNSNDGILNDMSGNEYYFNSYSFSKTHYRVTGLCKKTGKRKTIKTKKFPGLFLDRVLVHDPVCKKLKTNMPVDFSQAKGLTERWAVKMKVDSSPKRIRQVLEYRFMRCLDAWLEEEANPKMQNPIWLRYFENRVENYFREILE